MAQKVHFENQINCCYLSEDHARLDATTLSSFQVRRDSAIVKLENDIRIRHRYASGFIIKVS